MGKGMSAGGNPTSGKTISRRSGLVLFFHIRYIRLVAGRSSPAFNDAGNAALCPDKEAAASAGRSAIIHMAKTPYGIL